MPRAELQWRAPAPISIRDRTLGAPGPGPAHEKGGFDQDGRFATLAAVVDHYDNLFQTGLSSEEKADLVAYLRSL